ncbi:MAG: isopentenyl phosphate kinase [Thermoplasmata archaeon]
MILVKIGGSVITDKRKYKKIREGVIDRLASEFIVGESILIHGAGSFGHHIADEYALNDGLNENNRIKYSLVARDLQELNTTIIDKFIAHNKPAITIPVHSFHMVGEQFMYKRFVDYLERGILPVTYGDVILDPKKGMGICSGDQIAFHLSKSLKPKRVIFVTDVDGIYNKNPKIFSNARLIENLTSDQIVEFEGNVPDVTGSMEGKLRVMRAIAKLGIDVIVINGLVRGRLRKAMEGKELKGTRVLP